MNSLNIHNVTKVVVGRKKEDVAFDMKTRWQTITIYTDTGTDPEYGTEGLQITVFDWPEIEMEGDDGSKE